MGPLIATLEGLYVRLEPLDTGHGEDLAQAGQDERIWEFLSRSLTSLETVQAWIEDFKRDRERGIRYPFAIIEKKSGKAVGSTSYLNLRPEHKGLEIGWTWLSPEHWNTAINTECKLLLLRHAFETLGCIRVELKTDRRNHRSRKAIERLGAMFEGILRNHMILPDGTYRDSALYSITLSEWPGVEKWLQGKLLQNEK